MWRCKSCRGKVTKRINIWCGRAVGELDKEGYTTKTDLIDYEALDWFYECEECGENCEELKGIAEWSGE